METHTTKNIEPLLLPLHSSCSFSAQDGSLGTEVLVSADVRERRRQHESHLEASDEIWIKKGEEKKRESRKEGR